MNSSPLQAADATTAQDRPHSTTGLRRVQELDSLRGITALTVVFHHCLIVFPPLWALYESPRMTAAPIFAALGLTPLHLLWGGVEAVNVFFVLSGLVLALPFLNGTGPEYGCFVAKRVIRIYIPYFVVMTGAIFLMEALLPQGHPRTSSWLQQYWARHADGFTVRDYCLMLGNPRQNFVNPVTWSLVHEFRISLAFPILMWLVRTRRPAGLLSIAFLSSAGAKLAVHIAGEPRWWTTILDTCQYLFFFVAGAEMAKHREYLACAYRKMSRPQRVGALAGALLLVNARWELPVAWRTVSAVCLWAGATAIVALTLASAEPGSFLRWKPLAWLGEISYSLYLTHCLVLFSSLFFFRSIFPAYQIAALVPVVSLGVAVAVYRAVEAPAHLLARRVSTVRLTRSA